MKKMENIMNGKKYIKILAFALLFAPSLFAQRIGEIAPPKPPMEFPDNSWGMDIIFSEGGFGLGTFLRHDFSRTLTGSFDISLSEAKDEREIEYYDYYTGTTYVSNKKHRVFLVPAYFGLQYRLFANSVADNFRPYINLAVGPTIVAYNPYYEGEGDYKEQVDFFAAIPRTRAKYTAGGYVGVGANFGLDKKSLLGINLRYYYIKFFNGGVESLEENVFDSAGKPVLDQNGQQVMKGKVMDEFGGVFFTINLGIMY